MKILPIRSPEFFAFIVTLVLVFISIMGGFLIGLDSSRHRQDPTPEWKCNGPPETNDRNCTSK